jgi:hypothetical protein
MEASVELNTPFFVEPKFLYIHILKICIEEFVELNTPSMLNPSFIHPFLKNSCGGIC